MQHTAHRHSPTDDAGPSRLQASRVDFAHPRRNVAALGLQTGMSVADFGAGSGAYTLAIAERLDGTGRVFAIDVQRDLLRRITSEAAHRGYKNVEVIWADLETPRSSKMADGSIDLVLCEARRILKPTGSVAIIDWSESFGGMGPIKEDVVPKEAAVALAQKNGLALNREFSAGAHHYGLVL